MINGDDNMFKIKKVNNVGNTDLLNQYLKIASLDNETIFKQLQTNRKGLSNEETLKKLRKNGTNIIVSEKKKHWYHFLVKSIVDPFIIVLLVLSLSTYIIGTSNTDYIGSFIIFVIACISIIIRFSQEYHSHLSSLKLKHLIKTKANVLRDSKLKEIDVERLVIGDIVYVSAGSIIPADSKIIECKDLFISQALFTGESMPIEKYENFIETSNKSITDISNICLMGSTVISGTATILIINTGTHNYIGLMASSIKEEKEETNFDRGVKNVSYTLIKYMVIIVLVVFFINGIVKKDWFEALLFSISVAVGLTPGMLPMIVNTNLAKGSATLAKKKTIVKNLNAIQNLGAIDTLCTDKTGTLTENRIVLQKYLNVNGEEDTTVLQYAYYNSFFGTGVKNIIDKAIIEYAAGSDIKKLANEYRKIDEIPFDYERRIMSVVISTEEDNHILISKGALENVLSITNSVMKNGTVIPMTEKTKKQIINNVNILNEEGMQVIAVAIKKERVDIKTFTKKDEKDLIFAGYVAFLDPLKKDAKEALQSLKESGINIKILTGDGEEITTSICKQVNIDTSKVISGFEVDKLSDGELKKKCEECNIFVRMTPLQKNKIINILQSNGHVVGYMGDGVNDAPSLRSADVGISVNTATEIARTSSDIILLEKDLMVLKDGVITGRKIFGNIIKYMKMTLSSNFGNMFSVLVGSVFLPFLPMIPIQILIQNMLYDLSQTSLPWDDVDNEFLIKPQKWDISDLERYMKSIGIISSIYDGITYLVLWFILGYNEPHLQSYFQTGWFMEGLISQTLIVYFIRTSKIPFIESSPNRLVTLTTLIVSFCAIIIPFLPFANSLGFVIPNYKFYFILPGILIMYFLSIEIIKTMYIKKYHKWL
jgi:Mg2+-importing ATPase